VLALDAQGLYYLDGFLGDLWKQPLAGGPPVRLGTDCGPPAQIDGDSIYCTGGHNATELHRVMLDRSGEVVVPTEDARTASISGLVVDANSIYWINDRYIRRLAKSAMPR
jgi:hypothetical protein